MGLSKTLHHELNGHFSELCRFHSTRSLERSSLYRELKPRVMAILNSFEIENTAAVPEARPFYRALSWNVERGIHLEGITTLLKEHPILKEADVLLITETDVGMARSGNRNVAREMADILGMNYFFVPSYLNLAKGSGVEHEFEGENSLGIHGNAILSRYPIEDPEIVVLKNAHDKMKGREKRLGSQKALVASIRFPQKSVKVTCTHLDARSQQRHRAAQMKDILSHLSRYQGEPAIIGGDWNTSTYDSSRAVWTALGFWYRVAMGTGNVIRNHYPHPYRKFEKDLFRSLENHGFDFRNANQLGQGTLHYTVEDIAQFKNLREWIPNWCFRFVEWALKPHGGECQMKLDWFATRNVKVSQNGNSLSPQVVGGLRHRGQKVSDHDAIILDFAIS